MGTVPVVEIRVRVQLTPGKKCREIGVCMIYASKGRSIQKYES